MNTVIQIGLFGKPGQFEQNSTVSISRMETDMQNLNPPPKKKARHFCFFCAFFNSCWVEMTVHVMEFSDLRPLLAGSCSNDSLLRRVCLEHFGLHSTRKWTFPDCWTCSGLWAQEWRLFTDHHQSPAFSSAATCLFRHAAWQLNNENDSTRAVDTTPPDTQETPRLLRQST